MDEHHRIEREADEAFAAFRKKWPGNDAGDPTCVELWHHAWRAAVAAERERWRSAAHRAVTAGYDELPDALYALDELCGPNVANQPQP